MMDNNQGDKLIDSSSLTPIDIIDLTNESPIRIKQSFKRRLENIPASSNILIDLSSTDNRSVLSSNKTQDFPVSTSAGTKHNNVTKHTEDIVTLDDTIYIPDDDKDNISESNNGESLSLICPICLESLCSKLKPTTTRCGHIYCAQCLKIYLDKSKKCPTCNRTITLKSSTRLFL